jgi:hypothetical protein
MICGRAFSEDDNERVAPVAIISETVVRRYWPNSSAIGSHLTMLATSWNE